MLFVSILRTRHIITIPISISKKLKLTNKKLINCKLGDLEFISSVQNQKQSFCFVVPKFIVKKLDLKFGEKINLSVKLYPGKIKNRKELAVLNFNLFLRKSDGPYKIEDHIFSKINKQLGNCDFSADRNLLTIRTFHGKRYKFVNLPEEINKENLILFEYNNTLFIRQVSQKKLNIPTRFYSKDAKEHIKILKIIKKSNHFKKAKYPCITYKGRQFVDLKYFLPNRIAINGCYTALVVQEFPTNMLIVSYNLKKNKGKIRKPLIINRYIPLNLFVQFLGFYFGDGFKKNSPGIGGVNSEKSVIIWLNKFLKTYFEENIIYCIVHGNKKLDSISEKNVKKYWGGLCKTPVTRITYNKNNKNPKKFGSLRIYLSQIISHRIFNHLLEVFHKLIKKDSHLAKFYLRGLGMSDMGMCYKKGKLSCITIGHKKDDISLRHHYKAILTSYGVTGSLVYTHTSINVYNIKNYITFINDNIFIGHAARKIRLVKGFLGLDNGKKTIDRLKLLNKPLTAEEFRKTISINDDPYEQLLYFKKMNLVCEIPTYPKLYIISPYGKKLINNLNNS